MRTKITPELATELLAKNTKNRNLNKSLARKYASDMAAGLWPYTGDPIRVSKTGVLLDGQHRLQACIYAGKSFETELIENLPDEVRFAIDTGRKRTAADTLNMTQGRSMHAAALAASARQVLNYVTGFSPKEQQSTPAIMRLIDRQPQIFEAHKLAIKCAKIVPPGPMGAVIFLGTRSPDMAKRAMAFAEGVASGVDLQEDDPRLTLRTTFINARMGGVGARMPDHHWALIVIGRCWNAWATQQRLSRVVIRPNADGTLNYPEIIGGPPRGEGVASLDEVRASGGGRRAVAEAV